MRFVSVASDLAGKITGVTLDVTVGTKCPDHRITMNATA
jgi:hypothetical protein